MSNTRANAAVPLEPSKHPNPAQAATNLDLHQSAVRSHRAFFAKAQHFNGSFPPWKSVAAYFQAHSAGLKIR